MDTQKEREVFDVWYYDQQNEIGYDALLSAWLAAKAQAIPEGFVLVPKEPTSEMLYCGYAAPDNLAAKYKAMIEAAQEKEVV